MQITNSWVEQGHSQGHSEGLSEGLSQGRREGLAHEQKVILKQLNKRFGSVPTEVEEGVKNLELDGLESLAEAIFDFSSVDDVLAWFKK